MLYTKSFIKAALAMTVMISATSAMAANGDATIRIDQALLDTNQWVLTKLGNAVYTNTKPVSTVTLAANAAQTTTSPAFIDFAAGDGIKITIPPKAGSSVSTNFSLLNIAYDIPTNTILGTVKYGILNVLGNNTSNEPMLTVGTTANVGGNLVASNLNLHPDFQALIVDLGLDPSVLPLNTLLKDVTFQNYGFAAPAIPEPSTYALMGLGLVGISLVARRRRQAA